MRIQINGKPVELSGNTVADAVATLTTMHKGIAVAVDGEVVPRAGWDRELRPDAQVEILSARQGG